MEQTSDIPIEFRDRRNEALVSVWWTGTLLRKAFRRLFKDTFRSEGQFNLLRVLFYAEEEQTQSDLARQLLVDKSNITMLLDGLEERGLLKRVRSDRDRRVHNVCLTEKGKRLLIKTEEIYSNSIRIIMEDFSPEDLADLTALTRKLRSGMKENDLL